MPVLVILCLLAFATSGFPQGYRSSQKQDESFSVAATHRPSSTSFYVGIEKGYFRDEGLEVHLQHVPTGEKGLEALLSGQVDAAGAAATPIAKSVVSGGRIAVIATIAEIDEANVIIARKDSGIAGPGDLKGKAIGVPKGTGAAFFLHVYLVANYINPTEVRIVDIEPDKIVDALLQEEVDAVSTWSPYKLVLLEKLGPNAVVFADPALYLQTYNLVTTQDFVKSNLGRIEKFLRGVLRANDFIKKNPVESQAIMKKYVGTVSALYEKEWSSYNFTAVLDQSLILNLEDQARWMLKQSADTAHETPNFLDFIDAEPLKAVHHRAVRIIGK